MSRAKKNMPMTIKRYELIIAVVSLIGVLAATTATLIIQYRQSQRLELLQVTIRDTDELRDSLRKPLEGIWEHKIEFSKFFGQDTPYIATGKAIIVWRSATNDYVVYIGYGIKQLWGTEEVVTGFISGNLPANEDGWPAEPFEVPMRYEHRTGNGDFQRISSETFSFVRGVAYRNATKNRADQITMEFETASTFGKVTLRR